MGYGQGGLDLSDQSDKSDKNDENDENDENDRHDLSASQKKATPTAWEPWTWPVSQPKQGGYAAAVNSIIDKP